MRLPARTLVPTIFLFAILTGAISAAAGEGIVRGEVTDASGGVLPGVTVAAIAADGRILSTTITDAVGRYALALPEGQIKLEFRLEGFDTGSVELAVKPETETWLAERLRVAQLTERVVVYGKAPIDALPSRVSRPWPRPAVIPVPVQEMESICGPAKRTASQESIATIHSHRYDAGRTLYAKGDELNIDGGTLNGLQVGLNFVVRRYYHPNSASERVTTGEHTAGLVQIVAATERTSTAVVVHTCNELMQGDFLAAFKPEPVRTPELAGTPLFDDTIQILFADDGQMLGVPGRLLVIDRGSGRGIRAGQRLTLFRNDARRTAMPYIVGEAIVISVRTDSATILVERATDAIWFGDWAAPHRQWPADPPTAQDGTSRR